jgi:6-phosphogluconolactonase
MPDVLTLEDPSAAAEAAAEIIVATANAAVETSDRFTMALGGGSTPQEIYRLLAEPGFSKRMPWMRTWILFSDERCVPPDHPESNYGMAHDTLLRHVAIPHPQILRMDGEMQSAPRAAHFYEQSLQELFDGEAWPRVDLLLLGVGEDGHVAALFPGSDALAERERWVTGNFVSDTGSWWITLTLPALRAARQILFVVTGNAKADVVAEAFGRVPHPTAHPVELVLPADGQREVLLDLAAASKLPEDD